MGCASTALRLDRNVRDPISYYMLMLDRVRKLAEEFDILHFHIDQFHFPLFAQMADRTVTTLHGRQDLPDLKPLYIGFSKMPLVSISNDQRRPIAKANFVGTVHHGIPTNLHTPIYNPRGGCRDNHGRLTVATKQYVGIEQGTLGYGLRFFREKPRTTLMRRCNHWPRSTWFNCASEVDASVLLEVVQEGVRT